MTERKKSALDIANDLLARHVPALLAAFANVRGAKKAPQAMRSLQPLAFVFFLEAFGLAHLLTEEDRAAAWGAARGPGRNGDDYDPTDDTDEARALQWVAARQMALDSAYRKHAREVWLARGQRYTFAEFERQWGERNPIDPTTAPACFDPRAQLSILDALSPERDGILGVFLAETRLRAEDPPIIEHAGHKLDLTGCATLSDAAWHAVCERWIVYLDHRGATVGLRLLPPLDGIRTRLRAPLVNIIAADVEPASVVSVDHDPHEEAMSHYREGLARIMAGVDDPRGVAADYLGESWPPSSAPSAPILMVCPRCLDVNPGTPGGSPNAPHPGPFTERLCDPCEAATQAAVEPVAQPSPSHHAPIDDQRPASPSPEELHLRAASAATFARVEIDDEPAQKPKKDKRDKKPASGAEGKIKKNGRRAAT